MASTTTQKNCFVISPIGEAESETRKRSDQVLRHIIRPATQECGYKAVRADEIDKPGIITSQVIQHVVSDPLVIADLSETNPNVFYELAIRHAIKKPLVQIIQKGERIPFDVAGTRTIYFDHHDLDSVEEAKNGIIEQIRYLEKNPGDLETPISVSIDLQNLKQSDNPKDRSLADIVSAITELRSGITKLQEYSITSRNSISANETAELVEILPRKIAKELSKINRTNRSRRIIDPYMIKELIHILPRRTGGATGLLVILSFYREQFPWLYEIGMEAYRKANAGELDAARMIIKDLRKMAEMTIRGPWMEEWIGNDKETFMMMEELPYLLERFSEEIIENGKINHITNRST